MNIQEYDILDGTASKRVHKDLKKILFPFGPIFFSLKIDYLAFYSISKTKFYENVSLLQIAMFSGVKGTSVRIHAIEPLFQRQIPNS